MLRKIISGGQDGVDLAALRAAKDAGIETGGWMPRGFRVVGGVKPEYAALYGMKESASAECQPRTRQNILEADLTLIIGTDLFSRGCKLTHRLCNDLKRPVLRISWNPYGPQPSVFSTLCSILNRDDIHVVNIAGNRDPALEEPVYGWLCEIFGECVRNGWAIPKAPPLDKPESHDSFTRLDYAAMKVFQAAIPWGIDPTGPLEISVMREAIGGLAKAAKARADEKLS